MDFPGNRHIHRKYIPSAYLWYVTITGGKTPVRPKGSLIFRLSLTLPPVCKQAVLTLATDEILSLVLFSVTLFCLSV